jgi:hypothetical protein
MVDLQGEESVVLLHTWDRSGCLPGCSCDSARKPCNIMPCAGCLGMFNLDRGAITQLHSKASGLAEVDAAEIRIRGERRVGELIAAQKATVGLRGPQHSKGGGATGEVSRSRVQASLEGWLGSTQGLTPSLFLYNLHLVRSTPAVNAIRRSQIH